METEIEENINISEILKKSPSPKNKKLGGNFGFKLLDNYTDIKEIKEIHVKKDENLIYDFEHFDIFSLARHSKYDELEILLLKGLNPDSKDQFGNTLLIIGAQNGNKRIVKLCLRYGCQINMFNSMGNTALHFAIEYKYFDLVEYLIKKGSNPKIKNLRGIMAKDGIKKNENVMVIANNSTNNSNNQLFSKFCINKLNDKNDKEKKSSKIDKNNKNKSVSKEKNKKTKII